MVETDDLNVGGSNARETGEVRESPLTTAEVLLLSGFDES